MAWTTEQQHAISKTGCNIIVSAGAGSGKTAVLTTRVIEKIKSGISLDELLILTFTKAAAEEMKQRIESKLNTKDTQTSYITTFDSYSLSIVKKYHYLLNIPKNIEVTDEAVLNLEKRHILDEVFADFYEKDNNPYFQKLIKDFCFKDDDDIKENILRLINKLEQKTNLDDYLNTYIENYYNEVSLESYLNRYQQLLKEQIEDLYLEIEINESYFENDFLKKLFTSLSSLKEENTLNELLAKIKNTKLPALPKGSDEEVKQAKEKIANKLKELKELCKYGYEEDILEDIMATKDYMIIIIEIIKKFNQKLNAFKQQNYTYSFNDIAKLSLKILKENEPIKEEIKHHFKEIMIDEYQDTSDIQEEFISLIANNNVYMVGDIKQSIYRFRNANPYIFKEKYDNYTNEKIGIKIDLLKNFRSRDEVLEDINTIFKPIMTDKIGNANYVESHQMVFGNTSYIEEGKTNQQYHMEILEYAKVTNYDNAEIEFFQIAKDIQEKINNHYQIFNKDTKTLHDATYSDFCIIMDRNTSFELAKKIFEYEGIPLALYKDEILNDDNDIYIFKNIITILLSLTNKEYNYDFKYSFISVARSYLYQMTDEEIYDALTNNQIFNTKIIKDLNQININHLSLKEILETIITKTNIYEKLITKGDVKASEIRISKLLDITESLPGYDLNDFKNYLEELLKTNEPIKFNQGVNETNAVKIMNIHKSKGLEFPICYFCGLYKTFSKEDIKGLIIYEPNEPIYLPNRTNGIIETIIKLFIKDKIKKEDISEKIRLFYVALTRAKEKIIILLPKTETEELKQNDIVYDSIRYRYNSLASMLSSIPKTLKHYKKEIKDLHLTKDYLYPKTATSLSNPNNEKINVEPLNIEIKEINKTSYSKKIKQRITKEEKKNIDLGLKVHEILELIDFQNFNPDLIEDEFIKNLIIKLINQPIFNDIQKIYQEYEFIYQDNGEEKHGIIDLIIEHQNSIDIVDYKLSDITDELYINQLNGYQKYINSLTNKPTTIYLYSILKKELIKVPSCNR